MSSNARFVPNEAGMRELRQTLARAAQKVGFALEGAAKANSPVRGGHRSFQPDGPSGGTLRQSIHSAVYVDGRRIASSAEAGVEPLSESPGAGIEVLVGTSLEYAPYVHDGTVKMPARPFLQEAAVEVGPDIKGIIENELPPGWVARRSGS